MSNSLLRVKRAALREYRSTYIPSNLLPHTILPSVKLEPHNYDNFWKNVKCAPSPTEHMPIASKIPWLTCLYTIHTHYILLTLRATFLSQLESGLCQQKFSHFPRMPRTPSTSSPSSASSDSRTTAFRRP
jgi:hypothetical protein